MRAYQRVDQQTCTFLITLDRQRSAKDQSTITGSGRYSKNPNPLYQSPKKLETAHNRGDINVSRKLTTPAASADPRWIHLFDSQIHDDRNSIPVQRWNDIKRVSTISAVLTNHHLSPNMHQTINMIFVCNILEWNRDKYSFIS